MPWITSFLGTMAVDEVAPSGVFVIDVSDIFDGYNRPEIIYEKIDLVLNALAEGRKVWVRCFCGISRSNAIAAGALYVLDGKFHSYDDALYHVRKVNPKSNPNPDIIRAVKDVVQASYIPTKREEQEVSNAIHEIVSFLQAEMHRHNFSGYVKAVGSAPMGTFLSGDLDLDIFIVDPYYETAYTVLKQFWGGFRKEGALLIWHVQNMKLAGGLYEVDLVFVDPEDPKTDTLAHIDYYKPILSDSKRNEIRKAKALMKTYGAYSAELGGITGIALTELIARYDTVENMCEFLLSGEKWLDDPTAATTDPTRIRNLLASITKTKWKKVLQACREYRARAYFVYRKYTLEQFLDEYANYMFIEFPRRFDKAIDYARAMKCARACVNFLTNIERQRLNVHYEAYVGNYSVTLAVKAVPKILPRMRERHVSVNIPESHLRVFLAKYPEAQRIDDYYVIYVEREITNVEHFLRDCITRRWWQP